MTAPKGLSFDELDRALEARRAERTQAGASEQQGLESLMLMLALVPQWTEELIFRVGPEVPGLGKSLFGPQRTDPRVLLEQLEQRGWLQRTVAVSIPGEDESPAVLERNAEAAERVVSERLEQKGGREALENLVADLGREMLELMPPRKLGIEAYLAEEIPDYLPKITARWALLVDAAKKPKSFFSDPLGLQARVSSWEPVVEFFEDRLEPSSTHEALRWIEAAQPLADLLARALRTELDLAVRRAALALELRDRRRHDRQQLESFLERPDQIGALRELIDADEKAPWALHLLGSGGVGKTMLLRHLTAQMASAESLTIGRVDFDFLNPDYPRRAPGLLLWAFAQELRVFDSAGRASDLFEHSERALRQLHEELKGGEAVTVRATDHGLFQDGLEMYAQALEQLPQPVILVIDTCEELTKPRAGVEAGFNVDETFRILERLHDQLPSLRVVFAGRRPLAQAGAGWRCVTCEFSERAYLTLFEMRGFTVAEAERYLAALEVPSELVEPVIRRSSPDAGGAAQIEWSVGSGPDEGVMRCNPYELRFFADWARDVPPPSPADIANASGERYVELRILRRLEDQRVAELLPIFSRARHLDDELIGVLTGLEDQGLTDFLLELQQQEWIERRATTAGESMRLIFSVEEGLRLRLSSYFRARPSALEEQRRSAAEVLSRRLLAGAPSELDFADLDAALRVMAGEADADSWWRRVEERLFSVRDAQWVGQQAGLLTGPEGVAGEPVEASWSELRTVHPLRPAVLATLALAESRDPGGGLTPWMEVAETAGTLPNLGSDLELRARALVLSARLRIGQDPSPRDARDVWHLARQLGSPPAPETAAALVAALEAAVERYEEDPGAVGAADRLRLAPGDLSEEPQEDGDLATRWMLYLFQGWRRRAGDEWLVAPVYEDLEAMLQALDGRVTVALAPQMESATASFERALELARDSEGRRWLAWRAADPLVVRVALEAMRALYPRVLSPQETADLFGQEPSGQSLEHDRYLAALAELALAEGRRQRLFPLASQERFQPSSAPALGRAHVELPPVNVQRIRLDAARGRLEKAFSDWSNLGRQADSHDVRVVRHAARAELRWAVRLRFFDGEPGAALADSKREDDLELIGLAEAISGRERRQQATAIRDSLRIAHASWRCLRSPSQDRIEEAIRMARLTLDRAGPEGLRASEAQVVLDGLEAALLDQQRSVARKLDRLVEEFKLQRFEHPAEAWRIQLRRWALKNWGTGVRLASRRDQLEGLDSRWVGRLGLRRSGLIAWEEADFLALRSPAEAAVLFVTAYQLFAGAVDSVGAAVCRTAECCCLARESPEVVSERLKVLRAAWRQAEAALELQTEDETLEVEQAWRRVPEPLRAWWLRAFLLPWFVSEDPELRRKVPEIAGQLAQGPVEPLASWLTQRATLEPEAPASMKPDRPVPVPSPAPSRPPASPSELPPLDSATTPVQPDRVDRAAFAAGLLLGGLVVVVLVGGPFLLLGELFDLSALSSAVLTFFLLGLAAWTGGFAVLARTLIQRARSLRLELEPIERSGTVELRQTRISRSFHPFRWPPWGDPQMRVGRSRFEFEDAADRPYTEQGSALVEALGVGDPDPPSTLELRLADWHDRPWEGQLVGLYGEGGRMRLRRLTVEASRRYWISMPHPRFREPSTTEPPGVLVATRSGLGRDVAIRGYSSLQGWGVELRLLEGRPLEQLVASHQPTERPERVVHWIGRVIRSSAGLRFRLEFEGGRSQLDLRAEDLAERFPKAEVAILQEAPVAEMRPRSAADRRQAGWLRDFAGALQIAGVPTVLTLPHLEPAPAAACVERIGKLLRPRRDLLRLVLGDHAEEVDLALLDTVDDIRQRIRRAQNIDPEAAWDVVLYAPVGVAPSLQPGPKIYRQSDVSLEPKYHHRNRRRTSECRS